MVIWWAESMPWLVFTGRWRRNFHQAPVGPCAISRHARLWLILSLDQRGSADGPTGTRSGGPEELALSYRHSNVRGSEVVAGAVLQLERGVRDEIRVRVRELQRRRSESQPRKTRTFGSVFKNPAEGRGAGALIEACGLKGHAVGGARISTVHANFIENAGDARSADVAALVTLARACVRERFGVDLEHEVELLGPVTLG